MLERRARALLGLSPREPADEERDRDVVERGEGRDEVELLEDEPHRGRPEPGSLELAHGREVAPEDLAASRVLGKERRDDGDERRLARARGPDEHEELALGDLEVDLLQGDDAGFTRPVSLAYPPTSDRDHGVKSYPSRMARS